MGQILSENPASYREQTFGERRGYPRPASNGCKKGQAEDHILGHVAMLAKRHGLDPDLVLAVISVESAFRKDAVSPKGAQGLLQLMPGTARELGVKDALDPAQNLDGGARYLNALIAEFKGDLRLAIAAYNAGPNAVKRHRGVPPYRETRQHVEKVLERYKPQR